MAKLSLLLLYLRVFRPNVRLRYCIYLAVVFITLSYTSFFIAYAVLSIPKPGQTALASITSTEVAMDIPLAITQGSINVFTDFLILVLPIPVLWKLQQPRGKKIGILAIFMSGIL